MELKEERNPKRGKINNILIIRAIQSNKIIAQG